MTKSLEFYNRKFFYSLFNKESSGTISYKSQNRWLEIDVKHAQAYYDSGLVYEKEKNTQVLFIPIRLGCAGLRIIYKNNLERGE